MSEADKFRENADTCLYQARNTPDEPTSIRYRRMASAWSILAEDQDWLDDNVTGRATQLAEGAIDQFGEQGATREDISDRKRQLIEGPEEFRNLRVDQNK